MTARRGGEVGHVGVGVTPFETRADAVVRVAERADELGLDHMYVAEGWTHDAFVLLAELAGRTSRVRLGSGIVSVSRHPRRSRWRREPAAVLRVAGSRSGSAPAVCRSWRASTASASMGRSRGCATPTAVRALLEGERMPALAGGARALRLGVAPEGGVPIALAAPAPASVRLAGELADEWAPFPWARSHPRLRA